LDQEGNHALEYRRHTVAIAHNVKDSMFGISAVGSSLSGFSNQYFWLPR
jgi:hypothetical protein